jgi:hypothetical protein
MNRPAPARRRLCLRRAKSKRPRLQRSKDLTGFRNLLGPKSPKKEIKNELETVFAGRY